MEATGSKGPAIASPAQTTSAWIGLHEAVVALRMHERTCLQRVVDRYCAKGRELSVADEGAPCGAPPGES